LTEKFSVCQFFEDGSYEFVRQRVSTQEAVEAFRHYISSVGAKIGTTTRVIIVDSGDLITAEWIFGKGLVFPLPATKVI